MKRLLIKGNAEQARLAASSRGIKIRVIYESSREVIATTDVSTEDINLWFGELEQDENGFMAGTLLLWMEDLRTFQREIAAKKHAIIGYPIHSGKFDIAKGHVS